MQACLDRTKTEAKIVFFYWKSLNSEGSKSCKGQEHWAEALAKAWALIESWLMLFPTFGIKYWTKIEALEFASVAHQNKLLAMLKKFWQQFFHLLLGTPWRDSRSLDERKSIYLITKQLDRHYFILVEIWFEKTIILEASQIDGQPDRQAFLVTGWVIHGGYMIRF